MELRFAPSEQQLEETRRRRMSILVACRRRIEEVAS
jgi:hypothetical protein